MFSLRLVVCSLLMVMGAVGEAKAGLWPRKAKPDSQKTRQLIEVLRTESSAPRRAAAAAELRDHDPKGNMEVLSALIGALQRDSAEQVRLEAVRGLGSIEPYSAQAGLALERAADGDRSAEVQKAARDALWKYHLNGYRSQYFLERMLYQTPEPPLAKAGGIRKASASEATAQVIVRSEAASEETSVKSVLTPAQVPTGVLPPLVAPPGPLPTPAAEPAASPRLVTRVSFPLNRTEEPPLARRRPPIMTGR